MRNISTVVRGHYDNDKYIWAIIIRRFCDSWYQSIITRVIVVLLYKTSKRFGLNNSKLIFWSKLLLAYLNPLSVVSLAHVLKLRSEVSCYIALCYKILLHVLLKLLC
jgi:hypothetical protein